DHPECLLSHTRPLVPAQVWGGIVGSAGSAGCVKSLNGGKPNLPWRIGAKQDGRRVAVATDSYVRLALPLAEGQRATALWVRLATAKPRDLEVQVGGKKVGQATLEPGWQTAKVPLEGVAGAGEVELTLSFG